MSKFLEDFLATMPTTQQKKLMELLEIKQREGLIRSSHELQAEFERLLLDIQSRATGPTFKARNQSGKIDSKSFNANMEEIAFDLATIFEASSTIDRLTADNQQLSRSLLSSIQKSIYALRAKLERCKIMMKNSDGFTDSVYEQFSTSLYTETDEKFLQNLRKDRFNEYMDSTFSAEIIGDALQLAGSESTNQLSTNQGKRLARIEVLNRTGSQNENPENMIEKAIDGSLSSYWAENILVDQPIVQNINDLWKNDYSETPKDGAICELQITLNGITTVSTIQFDPFCAYPLEIVSIYGYETEDMGGTMYELISPNHVNFHQRSKKSVSLMTFQFPSVDISKIRILLRQENYVRENYIVNKNEQQNMEMWRKLATDSDLAKDYKNPNETIAEFDKKNEITGWSLYLDSLIEWASSLKQKGIIEAAKRAMKTIQMGDYKNPMLLKLQALSGRNDISNIEDDALQQSWSAVNKLSYLYGAYNISVSGKKYFNQSIYVTKPLPLSTNTTRITLSTDEKHHDIEIGNEVADTMTGERVAKDTVRITDIEYYITHKKNPTSMDWNPILPIEKEYVQGELLSGDLVAESPLEFQAIEDAGDELISYSLRFAVKSNSTLVLRRNGIPMSPTTYVISNDGRKLAIYSKYYVASSVYTVDYKPHDEAWFVNFDESTDVYPTQYVGTNGETGESFTKANLDNSITLKHKPYLFRHSLFAYNEDDNLYEQNNDKSKAVSPEFPMIVYVDGEEYKNITNYATNTYDEARLTENEGKTFAQIGEVIIFGKSIDGKPIVNITVDYYYVTTDIRMKAILRRNSVSNESVTPALYSYNIRCQSFDQEV